MRTAIRIMVVALGLAVSVSLTGCSLLRPTFVSYDDASSATQSVEASANKDAGPESIIGTFTIDRSPVLGTPVDIVDGVLYPGRVYIRIGATVTWINHDKYTQNVLGSDWGSTGIPPGKRFSMQFNRAGTYAYHNLFNPDMAGEVIVQ